MRSKDNLEKISIIDGIDGVLLEGNLGELVSLVLLENSLLEFRGTNGVIRLDVLKTELLKILQEEITSEKGEIK